MRAGRHSPSGRKMTLETFDTWGIAEIATVTFGPAIWMNTINRLWNRLCSQGCLNKCILSHICTFSCALTVNFPHPLSIVRSTGIMIKVICLILLNLFVIEWRWLLSTYVINRVAKRVVAKALAYSFKCFSCEEGVSPYSITWLQTN